MDSTAPETRATGLSSPPGDPAAAITAETVDPRRMVSGPCGLRPLRVHSIAQDAELLGLGTLTLTTAILARRPADYLEEEPPVVEVAAGARGRHRSPSVAGERWLAVDGGDRLVEVVAVDRSVLAEAAENGMGC
jgi:hypothetical protein